MDTYATVIIRLVVPARISGRLFFCGISVVGELGRCRNLRVGSRMILNILTTFLQTPDNACEIVAGIIPLIV